VETTLGVLNGPARGAFNDKLPCAQIVLTRFSDVNFMRAFHYAEARSVLSSLLAAKELGSAECRQILTRLVGATLDRVAELLETVLNTIEAGRKAVKVVVAAGWHWTWARTITRVSRLSAVSGAAYCGPPSAAGARR